ncbi:MAG: sugar phosphate isomerase/epimerase [Lachnospiraceae bacterium]|nr:sugar phosphate isomerase/epimerase [Lachnospiraceae bacterium]
MQPSATIKTCMKSFGGSQLNDYGDAVRMLYDAGYRVMDFSFVHQTHEDYILRGDDWQKKVDRVADVAASLGVTFSQSHLPYIKTGQRNTDPSFQKPGYEEYFWECMRRAYIASGMLGVRYATAHPISFSEVNYEEDASLKGNHRLYDSFVELGIKHNVGTAFENMLPSLDRRFPAKYCSHYDQLIRLVDSYNDSMVAVCWDTGHANQMKFDQVRALQAVGHRLKNLHINDNHYGLRDEHLLPFMGEINWYELIPVLAEIGYDGDMTFETPKVGEGAEGELQRAFLRLTYETGCKLVEIYQSALEK